MDATTSSPTFDDLLRRSAWREPDHPFVWWSDRDRTISYEDADALADRAASALTGLGVAPGDRVAILAHNGIDYVVAMLGAWRIGAISAHISVLVADELAWFVNDCTPSVLVYTHDLLPAIERDRSQMPSIRHYLCMDGPQAGALGWSEVLDGAGPYRGPRPSADDDAHLSFTSGSTGRPKGAVLRHGPTARAATAIAERLGLTRGDVSLGPTSLASSYGLVVNLLPGMQRGMTVGLRSKWDAATVASLLDERCVTYLPANPFLLAELLDHYRGHGTTPATLRTVATGGAPVPPALKRAWFDELGVSFRESYGQSELGGFVALGDHERPADHRFLAVGRPLPDREVAILGEDGNEVPRGHGGEIAIRGGVMSGYWGRPDKTAEVVRDGWLHTGDMGTMDLDDHVTLLGRWSDRIVHDGVVLYPRPIEEALVQHVDVRVCGVVGAPDAQHGAVPVAYVEARAGAALDAAALLQWYHARSGTDERLTRIVVLAEMPMTATGKIDKVTLRERAATT